MQHRLYILILALIITGCATAYKVIPDDYTGPTAEISDWYEREDSYKAQFFVLAAIDGHEVDNGIRQARGASYGKGFSLSGGFVSRRVPIRPLKLKLLATHVTGAPIHELASRAAGTFFSVEGEVTFTPAAGGVYVVKGELRKEGSSVWVEDAKTHQPVTEKIAEKK